MSRHVHHIESDAVIEITSDDDLFDVDSESDDSVMSLTTDAEDSSLSSGTISLLSTLSDTAVMSDVITQSTIVTPLVQDELQATQLTIGLLTQQATQQTVLTQQATQQSEQTVLTQQATQQSVLTQQATQQSVLTQEVPVISESLDVQPAASTSPPVSDVTLGGTVSDDVTLGDTVSDDVTHLHNVSEDDFRPTRCIKASTVQQKDEGSGDEGENCSICFEAWTNSGNHRVVSLKCGHLFGQSCIDKWLRGPNGKCPQCNARAHRNQIRVLFMKSLKVIDTTERDRALLALEREKEERMKAEKEAAQCRIRYQMALNECNKMKQEVERQQQQIGMLRSGVNSSQFTATTSTSLPGSQPQPQFVFEKHVRVCETGGCRVLAHSSYLATLCVSQPSSSALFPGFGVKKLCTLDMKTSQYVGIHSKPIRDLAFNSHNGDSLLLSCALDKTVKLTSLHSNSIVQTYECSYPAWAVAFNTDDSHYFYAGQQNGVVCVFDIRRLSSHVTQLQVDGCISPIVSLQYLSNAVNRPGGVLVGQLNNSLFYERCRDVADVYKSHPLPLEGNLTSLSVEETTSHILATYRPTVKHLAVRHQLYSLSAEFTPGSHTCLQCSGVHVFHGGSTQKLLARSRLVLHPTLPTQLLVCAGDEAALAVHVWNASTGRLSQVLPTSDPVMDLCTLTSGQNTLLVTLTEKQISVFKWK